MYLLPCGKQYNPDNNECCRTICPDKDVKQIDKCYDRFKALQEKPNTDRYGEELINTNRKDRLFIH